MVLDLAYACGKRNTFTITLDNTSHRTHTIQIKTDASEKGTRAPNPNEELMTREINESLKNEPRRRQNPNELFPKGELMRREINEGPVCALLEARRSG